MFAKLITLLLQSKAAALTGVFVIGTTGALVSATTQNGVTTVTITQTSPTTVVESPSPVASNLNLTPVSSPTTLTPSATPCDDQAHARADAVRRMNGEFNKDHQGLGQLARINRTAKDLETLRTADVLIKGIRQAAVKAIHATNTCADDEDQNDTDEHATDKAKAADDQDKDEHEDAAKGDVHAANSDEHHTTAGVTFSGTDPKAIADEAVAAMKLAFETAKNSVTNQVTTPTSPRTPEPKKHDGEGKGSDSRRGDHR